jgi:hypothetical protein
MADLQKMAPKLNWDDLTQRPALPLGSWLKTDPWDDRVHQLNAKIYAYMNPRDKMPLEVTPIFFKLQYYDASRLTPPVPPAGAQPDAAQPAAQPEAGAAPTTSPESSTSTAASPGSASADTQPTAATPDATPQQSTGTSQPPTQ